MKKKWCREYGMMCKDKNCSYEHLDEPPEGCDAKIEFKDTLYFGFCELDKGHEDNHRCLMFKWKNDGEEIIKVHNSYRLRGMNLIKIRLGSFE